MIKNNSILIKHYQNFIQKHNIKNSFLVGSVVIESILNRKVGDLDFSISNRQESKKIISVYKKGYSRLFFFSYHLHLYNDIDYYRNRYFILNLTDKKIIENNLFIAFDDIKVVIPEIEIAYKKIVSREKDILDLEYIMLNHYNEIQWEKVDQIINSYYKKTRIKKILVNLNRVVIKFLVITKKIFQKVFN